MNFGEVLVNEPKTQSLTISNVGTTTSLEVTSIKSNRTEFSLQQIEFPVTIAPGEAIPISVTFKPKKVVEVEGTLTIESNDFCSPLVVPLSGTGGWCCIPTYLQKTLAFGEVLVNTPKTLDLIIPNEGIVDLKITKITFQPPFSISQITLPITIKRSEATKIPVTFTPQDTDEVEDTLTIESNDSGSPLVVLLSGEGVKPNSTLLSRGI